MKKLVGLVLVVVVMFVFSTQLYAQSPCEKETKTEKTTKMSSSTCCGGNSLARYDDYKDDPLYKKMMEIKKKMDEEIKNVMPKAKEVYEKYGNWQELSEEERQAYLDEMKKLYEKYNEYKAEYDKVKKELDAKVDKDLAEKYKDNPLYAKMAEAKKKYDEANDALQKYYKENYEKYSSMNDDDKAEYEKKAKELMDAHMKTSKEYYAAKQEFENSLKEEEAKKYKDNPYYQDLQKLKAELEVLNKVFYEYLNSKAKLVEDMTEEEKTEYQEKLKEMQVQIRELEEKIAKAKKEFEENK